MVEYEVVFSGRSFVDGRGLSTMIGQSSGHACAQLGESTYESLGDAMTVRDRAQKARDKREQDQREEAIERYKRRLDEARKQIIRARLAGERVFFCKCGCGAPMPKHTRAGRRKVYLAQHRKVRPSRAKRRALIGWSRDLA